jgi:hypothetical protein
MDPEYLQQLIQMLLAAQQQGGGGGFDPEARYQDPAYGQDYFNVPKGAKVPTYRTQYTDYISDGNVPLNKAFTYADKFSPDALFDADPELKPILAQAVSQSGHDPYGTYAAVNGPEYQYALLQQAIKDQGLDPLDAQLGKDKFGRTEYPSIEDIIGDLSNKYGTKRVKSEALELNGNSFTPVDRYSDVGYGDILSQLVDAKNQQADDFITQAAPSNERNLNLIDYNWQRLGGMPYQGINTGSVDYEGTGPGFPTQQSQNPTPQGGGGGLADARRYLGGGGKAATPKSMSGPSTDRVKQVADMARAALSAARSKKPRK